MTKKTLFCVRGTGGRTLQAFNNGSSYGNFETMVGEGVNPAVWDVVDVAYPGDQWTLESFMAMQDTSAAGVKILTDLINALPAGRKFAIVGTSQGAMVASRVYDQIVGGSLSSRNSDLVAGVGIGNPRRKAGWSIPGGTSPGGSASRGVLHTDLMPTTDSRWWDFVNTGDLVADCPYTTPEGQARQLVFQAMQGNWFGGESFFGKIAADFNANVFTGLGLALEDVLNVARVVLEAFVMAFQIPLFANQELNTSPHIRYHFPYLNLPGNTTKSAVQLAVEYLDSVGGSGQPAPTPLTLVRQVDAACGHIRDRMKALKDSKPLIRLWMNNQNTATAGAAYVGRIDPDDTIKASFPFKNNVPSEGTIELRDDHYISMWLKKLPNSSLKKNVVLTVDFYGGVKRWSGLLDRWEVKTRDGVKYLELTFQDDLTFLQYLLCPPNPALPIPVFQFPRIFCLAGPSRWCVAMIIFLNLLRTQGNIWTLPDDPFDFDSWDDIVDWSDWQAHVMATPFLMDNSLWTFLSSRMNPVDAVVADTLDDAQLTIRYRRIITDDGEVCRPNAFVVDNVKNCALVFEVVDNSNVTNFTDGTFLQGTIADGMLRSVIQYGSGFVEDVFNILTEDNTLAPDEYFRNGFMGSLAKMPWVVLRDNEWTAIESSSLSWGPSKNVSVIVGGDNPAADAIAKLAIETVGNLLGALIMFNSLGTIIADVVMPFLVGTIAAWLQWKNLGRAQELGWIHYLESYQTGAEQNSWSLSAVAALRGGFLAGKSETAHTMQLHESWMIPGIHADIGHRIGSTIQAKGLEQIIWVNQLEEMAASWDNTPGSQQPYTWVLKAGRSKRSLTLGERLARLTKKITETANNIGVTIIQA